ncbi:MAG: hypothetical protein AAF570_14355 [Bacteroidota bacterium]
MTISPLKYHLNFRSTALALIGLLMFVHANAQDHPDYRGLFWQQLAGTCSQPVKWEKSITDLSEGAAYGTETKVFKVDCMKGTATEISNGTVRPLSFSEFSPVVAKYYLHPRMVDDYDIVYDAKSVTATLKADQAGRHPLRSQTFKVDASGILRYVETHTLKENLLYDLDMKMKVWFSADGRYERHEIETETNAALSGGMHTRINGALKR